MRNLSSSKDEMTSPREYFGTPEERLVQRKRRVYCPRCKSRDVHKSDREDVDEYECNRCGLTFRISENGTIW